MHSFQQVLADDPAFARGLFESLSANHLSSAGVEVYRALMNNMADVGEWAKHFLEPLREAIANTDDSNVQNNVRNQWLPSTLRCIKGE